MNLLTAKHCWVHERDHQGGNRTACWALCWEDYVPWRLQILGQGVDWSRHDLVRNTGNLGWFEIDHVSGDGKSVIAHPVWIKPLMYQPDLTEMKGN